MQNLSRFIFCAVSLLPLAASAAPNPAIVSADAKWMVYADFNVLRNSTLGKEMIAMAEKEVGTSDSPVIPNVQKILTTVGSVTAYGSNFSEKPDEMDGTLVAQGTPDLRKIAESILLTQTIAMPEQFVEIKDLGFPAYGVKQGPSPAPRAPKDGANAPKEGATEPKANAKTAATPRDPNKIEVVIAFPPEGTVIVSKSKAQITRARDLFNGKGASLAKSSSPLKRFATAANDAYLFAASETPPEKMFPTDAPPARIFKMAKAGSLALGEHAAEAYAHVELVAADDAMADKLMKILQGMTAIISMTETNDRQLGEFLNAANVSREGDMVTLNLSYPSARLLQMVANYHNSGQPQSRGPQGPFVQGRAVEKWHGSTYAPPADGAANVEQSHAIANVELKSGATITVARNLNGARFARFMRVEIAPAAGGAPLVFKSTGWMPAGPRGSASSFEFPGADGTYNLNVVSLVGDPEAKSEYALSVRDPRPAPAAKNQ
jgi:hypothetical protein